MKVRSRYEKPVIKYDHVYPPSAVKTAGYMPIAKRIDLMVRAGIQLQRTPLFYSPEGNETPLSTRQGDLYFRERNKKELANRVSEDLAKKASDASLAQRSALEKEIIANYLKEHPNPVVAPEAAPTETP